MSGDGEAKKDQAKAGRWEGEEGWVLLHHEQLLPLIFSRVSLEDASITPRQNWWLTKARVSKISV